MSINSNSSDTSLVTSNEYYSISNYIVEYLTMILIALGVVGITAGSHSIGLPLYKLNPMHWVIYFAILLRKPSVSSILILAFALPFTSLLLSGHPLVFKSLIMSIELSIYGIMFISVIKYFQFTLGFAFVISQITGRIIYYGLKYIFIKFKLIDSMFISTSLYLQMFVFCALGIALFLISKKYIAKKRINNIHFS